MSDHLPIESTPEVLGGTAVFRGTRVPVVTLLDYLEAGDRVDDFLNDFPTVSREAVTAVLEYVKGAIADHASAA